VLDLGQVGDRDTGRVQVRMRLDDPAETLANDLLGGTMGMTVTDADSSFDVARALTDCELRRRGRVACGATRSERITFTPVRRSESEWKVRIRLRKLSNEETGPRVPGSNPLEAPAEVMLHRGGTDSPFVPDTCRTGGTRRLVCRSQRR
jgi:hypothetical protein